MQGILKIYDDAKRTLAGVLDAAPSTGEGEICFLKPASSPWLA